MRALIASGDAFAAARIRAMLAKENLICDATDLGRDTLLFCRLYDYDIILLDLKVPDIEGYKLLQQLRAGQVQTPTLILSDRGGLDEKVKFLRFGAEDFLTKPFDLAVNLDTRVVSVDDHPVHLTPKEYGILELLSLRKGTIVTKGGVLNHLYGGVDEPQPKIIDILVCTLRKKLARATAGNHYIETVRGCGYMLRELATISAVTPVADSKNLSECREKSGGKRATVERAVRRPRHPKPQGARAPDQIEHQPTVSDRPIGRQCPPRVFGHDAKPTRVSLPVEVWFEDAVTSDGGPLRVRRPDPLGSLFGCASARCHE